MSWAPTPEEPTTMFVGCANPTCTAVITGDRELIMQELSLAGWRPGRYEPGMLCPRCSAEQ